MRQWWVCATALIAILLSACSSPGGSPAASQQPVAVAIGIVYVGGPAPDNSRHLAPGTIHLTGPGTDASQQVADGRTRVVPV